MTTDPNIRGQVGLADGQRVNQIGTTMMKWDESFSGVALNLERWSVHRQIGVGITWAVANSEIVFQMGTTIGDELMLVGKKIITNPANLTAVMRLSQKIAGNSVRVGFIEVDANGVPVVHASLADDFQNRATYAVGGAHSTTASTNHAETIAENGPIRTVTTASGWSITTLCDVAMELRPEDFIVAGATADTAGARSGAAVRVSSQVPRPNRLYAPVIWLKNTAVPASNTSVFISRLLLMDVQELQVEIGGGRGNTAGAQAIPVQVVGAATTAVTLTNATVSTTASGASQSRIKSAATTNLTLVKGSAGKLVGGFLFNTSGTTKFFKVYNKATAPVSTDTPVVTIPIPANSHVMLGAIWDNYGFTMATGIGYAITGGVADNDTTAVAVDDVTGTLIWV